MMQTLLKFGNQTHLLSKSAADWQANSLEHEPQQARARYHSSADIDID
jgi:hypothetical protein